MDYRRKALGGGEKLYFDLSEESSQAMDGMFKFLASKETDRVGPKTVRIKGRDVTFSKVTKNLVNPSIYCSNQMHFGNSDYRVFITK